MINIYNFNETSFNHRGDILKYPLKCEINEQLNGIYELNLEYPLDCDDAHLIENQKILKVNNYDGTQLFRIQYIEKDLDTIKVYAIHITYDLLGNFIEDIFIQGMNGTRALHEVLNRSVDNHNFVGVSDITTLNNSRLVRKNTLEAIMGDKDNSLLARWGGELYRDNFRLNWLKKIGSDKGVTIKYAKNLTGIEYKIDMSNLVTHYMPKGFDGFLLPEKYIVSPLANTYSPIINRRVLELEDVISKKVSPEQEGAVDHDQALELLRVKAQKSFENGADKPEITCTVAFVDLSQTKEYKNYAVLEKVYLGDVVAVKYRDIDIKTRCVGYSYDCIQDRYINIQLGNAPERDLISNAINSQEKLIVKLQEIEKNNVERAKDAIQESLNSGIGSNIKIYKDRILILDTDDEETARVVWRWNSSGLSVSTSGVNGNYRMATTNDGKFFAEIMTSFKVNSEMIEAGAVDFKHLSMSALDKFKEGLVTTEKLAEFEVNQERLRHEMSETIIKDVNTQVDNYVNNKKQELKGQDGESSYVHIKYSNNPTGNPMTDDSRATYVGIYTGKSKTPPTNHTKYLWSKIKNNEIFYKGYANSRDGLDFMIEKHDDNSKLLFKNRPRVNIISDNGIMDIWQANSLVWLKPNTKYTLTAKAKGNKHKLWAYFRNDKTYEQYDFGQLEFDNNLEIKSITFTTPSDIDETTDILFKFVLLPEDESWVGVQVDWFTIYEGDKVYTEFPTSEDAQSLKYRYFGYANKDSEPVASDFVWFDMQQKSKEDMTYKHIVYSDSADGSNFGHAPKKYIGIATTKSVVLPKDKSAYKWFKIKGDDGDSYTRNYLSGTSVVRQSLLINVDGFAIDPNMYHTVGLQTLGDLGFKLGDKITFIADYEVVPIGDLPVKISYLNFELHDNNGYRAWMSKQANPTVGTYVRTIDVTEDVLASTRVKLRADNVHAKIITRNARLIKGDKEQPWTIAQEDLKGRDGKTYYIHKKYSNSVKGTDMNDDASRTYIGIYTGTSETPPEQPEQYSWSRIKGQDGADGRPGAKGADGRTSYLHTAYMNDLVTREGFSTTESKDKKYIGTYTDFIQADSTNPDSYKWVRIKGDDGVIPDRNLLIATEFKNLSDVNLVNTLNAKLNVNDYNGHNSIEWQASNLASNGWRGITVNSSINSLKRGNKIVIRLPIYIFNDVAVDGGIKLRLKNHRKNTTLKEFNLSEGTPTNQWFIKELKFTVENNFNFEDYNSFYISIEKNGHVKIAEPYMSYGSEVPKMWTPALIDLQGHSLTGNLRLEGSYLNNNLSRFKAFVDVYYDGNKITSGFTVKTKHKGIGYSEWTEFKNIDYNTDGYLRGLNFSDGDKDGKPLEVIALISYKELNIVVNARLDNTIDVRLIQDTVEKFKTFESTLDNFTSKLSQVEKKKYSIAQNKQNLCLESDKIKTGNDLYFKTKTLKANTKYIVLADVQNAPSNQHTRVYNAKNKGDVKPLVNGLNVWRISYEQDQEKVNLYPLGNNTTVSDVVVYEDIEIDIRKENLYVSHDELYGNAGIIFTISEEVRNNAIYTIKFNATGIITNDSKWKRFNNSTISEKPLLNGANEWTFRGMYDPSNENSMSFFITDADVIISDVEIYRDNFHIEYVAELNVSEMESRFHQELEKIETSVIKSSDFGTILTQNAEHLRLAWNNIANYVQFENAGLSFYEGTTTTNNLRARIDDGSYSFWRDGYKLGSMGTGYYSYDSSKKGIQFHLEYDGAFLGWAHRQKKTDTVFTWKWYYAAKSFAKAQADTLNAGCNVDLHGFNLSNFKTNTSSLTISDGVNGSIQYVSEIKALDDGRVQWYYKNLFFRHGILINVYD